MSLVKYNNNSLASVDDVSGSNNAMVLIKTVTASSSGTVTFVNGTSDVVLDSTYPIYKVVIINAHPSSEQKFYVNFRDGATNYDASKNTTVFRTYHFERDNAGDNGLGYQDGLDLANGTGDQMIGQEIATDNDASGSGELWLFNPSSTTYTKHFIARFTHHYTNAAPGCVENYTAGYINTTTAIDGIQFKFASGNIDAGTFKLYGIKDS
tara:strand:- start:60 stop:686 length:627 start_codon:yes stop_codon:yes gene_type:complete